jgi:hypothetical protein
MPNNVSIEALENALNTIRQRKTARRLLAGPQNTAKPHDVSATIAKLHALQTEARVEAGKALAKLPARPTPPPRPPVKVSTATSRTARREAARTASTFSAGTAENFSDNYVADLARHASTSPADREIATAELTRRGITLHANGSTTRSTRKI